VDPHDPNVADVAKERVSCKPARMGWKDGMALLQGPPRSKCGLCRQETLTPAKCKRRRRDDDDKHLLCVHDSFKLGQFSMLVSGSLFIARWHISWCIWAAVILIDRAVPLVHNRKLGTFWAAVGRGLGSAAINKLQKL